MRTMIVVNNPKDWPMEIPGVEVISAKSYLSDPAISGTRRALVFNLCRSYKYQSAGYYVSLLAAARGHRHMPDIGDIQGMKSNQIVRHVSEDLDPLIQRSLRRLQSDRFTLSVYFGRNMAVKYEALSRQLFNAFQTPLLRAHFALDDKWRLRRITPVAAREIPENHREFVMEAARSYFAHPRFASRARRKGGYAIAILCDPAERTPPSDTRAINKFMKAARAVGLEPELIDKDDYGRLAEFDALFIRETTSVESHTFRFAQRAAAEGLVVIDDPMSILRCSNKVYLAELLARHNIPAPRTIIISSENIDDPPAEMNYPIILKQPDSSFSQGVVKADDEEGFKTIARGLLEDSELIIAQEYTPTDYDWRVGVLDRSPLYVCRYFMARKHWQIIRTLGDGSLVEGRTQAIPVADAPPKLIKTAVAAANLIGDGLYGVDVKQIGGKFLVIEVNDNPSVEAGYEDEALKDELYMAVMRSFLARIEKSKGNNRH